MEVTSEKINEILNKITDETQRITIRNDLSALGLNEEEKSRKQNKIELYKLEYDKASERYENIYKAIWTNFSLLSFVAGGILTFGNSVYSSPRLIAFLACLPLIFWYVATFIPMNQYGYKAADRLSEIERTLNKEFSTSLSHYSDFSSRNADSSWRGKIGKIFLRPNVGIALWGFSLILCIIAGYSAWTFITNESPQLQHHKVNFTKDFVDKLAAPNADSNIQFIQNELSGQTKQLLQARKPETQLTNEVQSNIIADLNKIIEGRPLFDKKNPNTSLLSRSDDIPDIFAQADTSDKLLKANRVFLARLFSDSISEPRNFSWRALIYLKPIKTNWIRRLIYIVLIIILVQILREGYFQIVERVIKAKRRAGVHLLTAFSESNKKVIRTIHLKSSKDLAKFVSAENSFMKLTDLTANEFKNIQTPLALAFVKENGKEIWLTISFKQLDDILKALEEKERATVEKQAAEDRYNELMKSIQG